MVISPCLLDFLEKALETIPITPVDRNYSGVFEASQRQRSLAASSLELIRFCFASASALAPQEDDMGQFDAEQLEESTTSLVSSSTSAYSSFPVDVVVYVRVQVFTTVSPNLETLRPWIL